MHHPVPYIKKIYIFKKITIGILTQYTFIIVTSTPHFEMSYTSNNFCLVGIKLTLSLKQS